MEFACFKVSADQWRS